MDLEQEFPERFAVCLLLRRPDGLILAVGRTRKSGTVGDWGLPGGKVEEGESLHDAVVREIAEETGIRLDPVEIDIVFSAPCDEGGGLFEVVTFSASYAGQVPRDSSEGPVAWVTPYELASSLCTFSGYNRKLFEHVGVEWMLS